MRINNISLSNNHTLKNMKTDNRFSDSRCMNFYGQNKTDPLYYQAVYGIFPNQPVILMGKTKDGKDFTITIESEFAKKFLLNKNGQLNQAVFKSFAQIHNRIMEDLNKRYQDEIKKDGSILGNAFPESIFSSIDAMLKKVAQENIANVPNQAYDKTKRYFELSQNHVGLNLSDYEKKLKLTDEIEYHTRNDLYPHDENVTCEQILKYATDEYGMLDYDFIYDVFDVISAQSAAVSFKDTAIMLKKYYSYDEESKIQIKNAMEFLNDGYFFSLYQDGKNFDRLMKLCFNADKKFIEEKFLMLKQAVIMISEKLDSAINNIDPQPLGVDGFPIDLSTNMENNPKYIRRKLIDTSANVIVGYFDEISDTKGNIKPQRKSFEEYIKTLL